MRLNKKRSNL